MHKASFLASFFILTWICAAEAVFVGAALALGGLAALKGAALVGLAIGKHKKYHYHHHRRPYYHGRSHGHYNYHYRYGRSVDGDPPAEDGEDLLLATVGQLDPNGCVLKLLCQAHIKEESFRTVEENILVDMFANATDTLTAYNAAFVYATDVGVKTQDPLACKKFFPNCPLDQTQLVGLLQRAWGCGIDFFIDGDEEEMPQEEELIFDRQQQQQQQQQPPKLVASPKIPEVPVIKSMKDKLLSQ